MDGSRKKHPSIASRLAQLASAGFPCSAGSLSKLLLPMLVLPLSALAEPGLWLATDYHHEFNENLSIRGDNQWRSWDLAKSDFNTLLLRNSVVYRQLGIGYAFLNRGDFGESSRVRTEHRTFQDFYFKSHRLRTEQRWVDGEFSTRYRWKIGFRRNNWFGYNELFITPDGFNQNRTKLGYRATRHLSLAAQYIYSDRDTMQLVLTWHL